MVSELFFLLLSSQALRKRAIQQYSVLITTEDERVTGSFTVTVSGPSSAVLTDIATTTTVTDTSTAVVTVPSITTGSSE